MHQQIFDTVLEKLLAQGCRSRLGDSHIDSYCAYRGNNGTKCAIGHLIPDELYKEEIEGLTVATKWHRVRDCLPLEIQEFGDKNKEFLIELQRAHDQAYIPSDFRQLFQNYMKAIAEQYHLTYKEQV